MDNARLLPGVSIANKPRALATAADIVDNHIYEDGVVGQFNVCATYDRVNDVYDVVARQLTSFHLGFHLEEIVRRLAILLLLPDSDVAGVRLFALGLHHEKFADEGSLVELLSIKVCEDQTCDVCGPTNATYLHEVHRIHVDLLLNILSYLA